MTYLVPLADLVPDEADETDEAAEAGDDCTDQDDASRCNQAQAPSTDQPIVQNEPTAASSAPTPAPAESCAPTSGPDMDRTISEVVRNLLHLRQDARFEDREE